MDPRLYNAEAVCRAMGIPHFADRADLAGDRSAFRLVLRPSFHPEVCLTVVGSSVTVSTLYESLWHQPFPCILSSVNRRFEIEPDCKLRLTALFKAALDDVANPDRPVIMCDGMMCDVAWHAGPAIGELSAGVTGQPITDFIQCAVQAAHDFIDHDLIRNNLAACGRYVGLDLPITMSPAASSHQKFIGILGTPDDRNDLIRQIPNARRAT